MMLRRHSICTTNPRREALVAGFGRNLFDDLRVPASLSRLDSAVFGAHVSRLLSAPPEISNAFFARPEQASFQPLPSALRDESEYQAIYSGWRDAEPSSRRKRTWPLKMKNSHSESANSWKPPNSHAFSGFIKPTVKPAKARAGVMEVFSSIPAEPKVSSSEPTTADQVPSSEHEMTTTITTVVDVFTSSSNGNELNESHMELTSTEATDLQIDNQSISSEDVRPNMQDIDEPFTSQDKKVTSEEMDDQDPVNSQNRLQYALIDSEKFKPTLRRNSSNLSELSSGTYDDLLDLSDFEDSDEDSKDNEDVKDDLENCDDSGSFFTVTPITQTSTPIAAAFTAFPLKPQSNAGVNPAQPPRSILVGSAKNIDDKRKFFKNHVAAHHRGNLHVGFDDAAQPPLHIETQSARRVSFMKVANVKHVHTTFYPSPSDSPKAYPTLVPTQRSMPPSDCTPQQQNDVLRKLRQLLRKYQLTYADLLRLAIGKFSLSEDLPPYVEEFMDWVMKYRPTDPETGLQTKLNWMDRRWLKPIVEDTWGVHSKYSPGLYL